MSTSETSCLGCGLQHNDTVRFRAYAFIIAAAILLAGCGSPNGRNRSQSPVWEDVQTVVPSEPSFPVAGPIDTTPAHPAKTPATPDTALPSASEIWIPLQRWAHANSSGLVVRLNAGPPPAYALQTTNGSFVFHTGNQSAQWHGMELRLGFAPQLIDGQPYLHTLDLSKTVQPLLQADTATVLSQNSVIVIDPGHGGENAGTRSVLGNHYEKEFTLDWGLRLQALLLSSGYKVYLTRSNDNDLALSNRVTVAAQRKADLFVSLHFNSAGPNDNEAGLETYCLTPCGMPSSLTRGFPDEVLQTFPNNAFDTQNLWLALRIHRALLQVNGHHDRGIRRARFPGVLRNQQRAAILVEGGYLSNPQEARLISDPSYRQKLAEAVAKALLPSSDTSGTVALNSSSAQGSTKTTASPNPTVAEPGAKASASEFPDDRVR